MGYRRCLNAKNAAFIYKGSKTLFVNQQFYKLYRNFLSSIVGYDLAGPRPVASSLY